MQPKQQKVKRDSAEHRIRQSTNQKVERSEEDVKKHFREILTPLIILVVLDILISFAVLVQ